MHFYLNADNYLTKLEKFWHQRNGHDLNNGLDEIIQYLFTIIIVTNFFELIFCISSYFEKAIIAGF